MEIAKISPYERIKNIFLKEPKPFTRKREVNWGKVKTTIAIIISLGVLGILIIPTAPVEETTFHEKTEVGSSVPISDENDPTSETLKVMNSSQVNTRTVHSSLDYLYRESSPESRTGSGGGQGLAASHERSGTMILTRGGTDSKTQLSPGTRFLVRLSEKVVVANHAMPIMGIIAKDVMNEDTLAIPAGAKLIGDISFDDSNERAQIAWRSIILPDGRERPLSAIGVGRDGQVGVDGNVKSDGLKNTAGQTLTRFIGAYAQGSMSRGQLGANEGGHDNGLKNAIAETAKDRANAWAENLSKEKKWIELHMGAEFYTVLNQPFLFKDPGAIYGK